MGSVERFGGGVGGDSTHGHAAAVSNETGEWEFVEPKVPDGISLRNFGIQAPVYATISDIVVYSPQGNTSASISLAQKFKQAIEKKYSQRLERLRLVHPNASPEEDFGLVKYNVFVLDATPDEIHVHLEHLVTRVEDINIPHSHTDGTDAHAHGDVPDSPPSVYDSDSSPSTPGYDQAEKGIPNVANARKFRKLPANTINFAQREKDEMRDLTRASEIMTFFPSPPTSPSADTQDLEDKEQISGSSTATLWDPTLGQIFLGNASDVPLPMEDPLYSHRNARSSPHSQSRRPTSTIDNCSESCSCLDDEDWDWSGNDPAQGFGYDICIECDDLAPFPSPTQMKKAEEHIRSMEKSWVDRCLRRYASAPSTPPPEGSEEQGEEMVDVVQIPPRPPPNPNAVIHLPFPSSVTYTTSLLPFLSWLESLMRPQQPVEIHIQPPQTAAKEKGKGVVGRRGSVATMGNGSSSGFMPSSLPPPSAFPSPFLPSESPSPSSFQRVRSTSATFSPSSSAPTQSHTLSSSSSSFPSLRQSRTQTPPIVPSQQPLTRPLKVLIYSADGYTESSSLALCLLMAFKNLSLPEAYLELQLEKRRSFFVYVGEVGALKRVEARLEKERNASLGVGAGWITGTANSKAVARRPAHSLSFNSPPTSIQTSFFGSSPQSALKAMNEMQPASAHPLSTSVPKDTTLGAPPSPTANNRLRKRASTMPQMPSFTDHQAWFQDPRFDGSFPSRVLPFLYLGNLNHASNAYMLHALGITHVVSVGECALIPPPQHYSSSHGPNSHEFVHGAGPNGQGSLWIEEREGRIKVLDIKGVCDDGIDTLEPQLGPICEWIDRARAEGGKVLVHCRVGVSRSATVTIAYVMQHLDIPLVDAYLIVRSRRLSVLIQPNMRLLYNLIGWELRLAMEKCREEKDEKRREERLRRELSRCVNWPYLAKEVHALNEKYLR
ncbi:hypothetical protein BXZ70DRAFT_745283 [Cristinia sonorae]|uniref:Uncharacterized protein n=1 Tax=Cristinia sonorae TaxID=1940300 RepID=A0A8K0UCV1_9AGAR|nr:hypothetical protein BXZ70DRAFT_745283 [Cristinia sonorae]